MTELTLDVARKILDVALAKGVEKKLKPLVVTVLDARGCVKISAAQDGSLSGTVDYPDESVSGVLITAITYKDHALHFEVNSIPASYDGTMDEAHTQITGTWKPTGLSLILKRTS